MELTTAQKDLMKLLKALKLDPELIVLVMMACQTNERAVEMINFLIANMTTMNK